MLEIYNGPLKVEEILSCWYNKFKDKNYGAFINFVGIVRDENGIDGLSFDIYEPLLKNWFNSWRCSQPYNFLYISSAFSKKKSFS